MPAPDVRRFLLAGEERLSPYAARSSTSRGRSRPEADDPLRTAFQVDRDRILRTKAFRRLKHKTQVFIAPTQDHYVTRLTHTLEVMQVARTIARALRLNEDLAEAAALGHDIGHGPFGHAGEEALAERLPGGFRHNLHSVRVLERLENGGLGLNLCYETLDAIARSSKERAGILAEGWGVPETLEGQVVKVADAIAYISHDFDDAVRAGLIDDDALPASARAVLGATAEERRSALIADVIEASAAAAGGEPGEAPPVIHFSPGVAPAADELREFMFQHVYLSGPAHESAARGKHIALFLYDYFVSHPAEISAGFSLPDDPVEQQAADFVSGMTDRYAIRVAREHGCDVAMAFTV